MSPSEASKILRECEFEDYTFVLNINEREVMTLHAEYLDRDYVTGRDELQKTRKWLLSQHMTRSELVQTAFKCIVTSMEHRAREGFKYKGKRVFGPHFDVDALWRICADKQFDYREDNRGR